MAKTLHTRFLWLILILAPAACAGPDDGYRLVWADEFDYTGKPDTTKWRYETGFIRNSEPQWYQPQNAEVADGLLRITARRERVPNPGYIPGSEDWRTNRQWAEYTSAAVVTTGLHEWTFGRFEIRAKFPPDEGAWPAIWFRGNKTHRPWPLCGEIDLMEFYRVGGEPTLLANTCWGEGIWDTTHTPLAHFLERDPQWCEKFHVWTMEWTPEYIRLSVDGELLNDTDLSLTINPDGVNPFHLPVHMLLNMAVGRPGESLENTPFPLVYEIDYVRIYQKKQ